MELIFLIALILVGFALAKTEILTIKRASLLNKWIIYAALPAVALLKIPGLEFSKNLIIPALSPMLIFGFSALLFFVIFKSKFTENEKIVLSITAGLGNTSFIGFPLINFYFGSDYLPFAVIFDQGSFFLLATAAQYLILSGSADFSFKNSLKRIVSFPPFIALCVAFVIPESWILGLTQYILTLLSYTISPVAMVVVGFQIARFLNFSFSVALLYGLIYKLIGAPLLITAIVKLFATAKNIETISVFEAGMPPMITGIILLTDAELESKLAAQMLFWGTIFGLFTTFILSTLLYSP